jgi:hypothetical protein
MSQRVPVLLALFVTACSEPAREAEPEPEPTPLEEPVAEEPREPEPTAPSCDARAEEAARAIAAIVASHARCEFDVDCVHAGVATDCFGSCQHAIHPAGLDALADASRAIDCAAWTAASCPPRIPQCARSTPRCDAGTCIMREGEAPLRDVPIPAENERSSSPPRPDPAEPEQERARRLFLAIQRDDPSLAQDFFFPREAFAKVKAIAGADAYWQRLFARYAADIHALHESVTDLDRAEFDRLEIVRRGGWVVPGEEANALPYWAARHNLLHYRVGDDARTIEVRVVITWGERWYITHLSEFH